MIIRSIHLKYNSRGSTPPILFCFGSVATPMSVLCHQRPILFSRGQLPMLCFTHWLGDSNFRRRALLASESKFASDLPPAF